MKHACLALLGVALAAAGCTSNSLQPSVGAPSPSSPSSGAIIAFTNQPITLTIANASTTGSGAGTYTFEVATDPAFANKVATLNNVVSGSSGQTSVQLSSLAGGTYYWHARVQQGSTAGTFSSIYTFTVGAHVTISAPGLNLPANGASIEGWPAFTVTDVLKSGTTSPLVYRFEISTNSTFSSILLTATVPETAGQTTYAPATFSAPPAQQLFWRVTPIDQVDGVTGPTSSVQSFTVFNATQGNLAILEGLVLWPGAQPPGTTGHATIGTNWGIARKVSFDGVSYLSPELAELQLFDLLDRGMDPQSAIDWMNNNGYPTIAVYYAGPIVIGFEHQYMAQIDPGSGNPSSSGEWDLVDRAGA